MLKSLFFLKHKALIFIVVLLGFLLNLNSLLCAQDPKDDLTKTVEAACQQMRSDMEAFFNMFNRYPNEFEDTPYKKSALYPEVIFEQFKPYTDKNGFHCYTFVAYSEKDHNIRYKVDSCEPNDNFVTKF
jgi:DNA polymerase sigma